MSMRQSPMIPQVRERFDSIKTQAVIQISAVTQQNMKVSAVEAAAPPQPPVNDSVKIDPFGGVDPLAGLETALPGINAGTDENSTSWSISWANNRERGILSFPMIDADVFPEETEKLLNVLVRIGVSPEGGVLSAEVVPPGSGNTSIDRLMYLATLQFVFEPWPYDEGVQTGSLRLVFQDGYR